MSVHIQLDQQQILFTNLDVLSGRVVLNLNREETIGAINVKLEGESRTRLAHPYNAQQRRRGRESELEVHKLLYTVQNVFPPIEPAPGANFVLPYGQHIYRFSFKLPFNNICHSSTYAVRTMGLQMGLPDRSGHIKQLLPPTLSGFPGEAEIKYFVKVTVERPSLFKENYRHIHNFKFLPIEPPRPPANNRESFGRRQHQFSAHSPLAEKPSVFRKSSIPAAGVPPAVAVEARLPDPAIVTCNEPLPLRVVVTRTNGSVETLTLQTFQITLWGFTKVRARMLERTETSHWVLCSFANMHRELRPGRKDSASEGKDQAQDMARVLHIDQQLWSSIPLPSTVCPSFDTCNLGRRYEIEVSVGLQWGSPGNLRPELTVQPIRLPCQVFSGIHPSAQLLKVMNSAPSYVPVTPPRPGQATQPAMPASSSGAPPPPLYEEPPPSYEDAMAAELAPVDGPRRDYTVADSAPVEDSKR